ncbi:MAG: PRC-barrel domain-containing protein [Anaerolineaceae bacterium]|jgi:sporulation protein YlmC with PRC-barrel domain|nr:PRC-barrel domain-containing protein [Anaerolineaceae bacterium]
MHTEKTTPSVLSASTIINTSVENSYGENLGKIEELMVDLNSGRIAYAVLSFGGFLGMGNKLFALPFEALTVDTTNEKIILDVDKEILENAPGFDKDNWPEVTEHAWLVDVYNYYGYRPYWDV